ncbi:MAG TPA: maleylpyruvate isomerase family mycothiol-dependent enzyme [Thermomonospora sp.]|nr:maleylpyruvate isomerase family mycothiol-dependent enzyme [Thermomonospora sp.]
MRFPHEDDLRAERFRLIETLDGLSDDDFDHGPTLCAGWAPRDVLGHVIGLDYPAASYLPYGTRIHAAHHAQTQRARAVPRERLMRWAGHWAANPSGTSRMLAFLVFPDLAVHHQDVLRGLGLTREIPDVVANAILREGAQLSLVTNRRILTHRVVPADGGRPLGRGPQVHGTREALGLWLAGRDAVTGELEFRS